MDRYNHLNKYYKDKFGERVLKICVDGGFTCPNRDGAKGVGGCAFCTSRGSGDHIKFLDVETQVRQHLDSYRGQRANKFIVYFQNFSNTYSSVENLKKVYDSALVDDRIVGIAIATRPDCISESVVDLLKSYKEKYFVMVELGLQTADDNIANIMNLRYSVEDFNNAVRMLKRADIEVVAHMMVGLPNETQQSIDKTLEVINCSRVDGIKIHNLYIAEGTRCHEMFLNGNIKELSVDEYLVILEYIITHLRSDIIIHRICADAPKEKLVSPLWNTHKKLILNGIEKRMIQNKTFQGCFVTKDI